MTSEEMKNKNKEWRESHPNYHKEWRAKNKDKIRIQRSLYLIEHPEDPDIKKERMKKWRMENPAKMKAQHALWIAKNPGIQKKITEEWRKANKDRIKSYQKEYRSKHPEIHRDSEHRRRARKVGVGAEIINEALIFERDRWVCQLCKKKVNKRLKYPNMLCASLDHIVPLSKGGLHAHTNVHLTHLKCNVKAHVGGIKQLLLIG